MKKDAFAHGVLDLWITTQIPLTHANLQYHTGASRRKVRKFTEQMVLDGELELDSDDAGEMFFTVPGAARPAAGARTFAERDRLAALRADVTAEAARKQRRKAEARARLERQQAEQTAMTVAEPRRKRSLMDRLRSRYDTGTALSVVSGRGLQRGDADKSLAVSGALSFFLGPLGWLYAGSYREAIPASLGFLAATAIIPSFLLWPLLPLALPLSGIAGVVYAWQYNRSGRRQPILGDGRTDEH